MRRKRVEVRELTPRDWRSLRKIRRRALCNAPNAFAATRTEVESWTGRRWRAEFAHSTWFAAYRGMRQVGVVRWSQSEQSPFEYYVESLWVEPRARRHGVATKLMMHLIQRAADNGVRRLMLWVLDGNDSARGFYDQLHFRSTGVRKELSAHDPRIEERLSFDVARLWVRDQ